jgi:hypothetical protein
MYFIVMCTFRFGTWHSIKSEFQTDQVFEGSASVTNVDERQKPTSRDDAQRQRPTSRDDEGQRPTSRDAQRQRPTSRDAQRQKPTSRDGEDQGPFLTISQSSSVHKAEMVDGTVETRSESK